MAKNDFQYGGWNSYTLQCGTIIVPRVQTQRYGSHSLRVSGPTVWNSLPQNLRSSDISREQFKRGLKTWLFERAYV